jgi:hypothetical protein
MEQWPAVRDDCGVVAGHRAGGGGGAGLPALGRVVMPCDRSRNRSVSEENATWRGARRSSLGDHKVGPRCFSEFRLGAGPRRLVRSWSAGRSWVVARPRLPVARARLEEVEAAARGQSSAVADGCDSVGLGPGGVVCRGWWPCSADRRASAASAGRHVGRWSYSSAPGADWAETSVHTL